MPLFVYRVYRVRLRFFVVVGQTCVAWTLYRVSHQSKPATARLFLFSDRPLLGIYSIVGSKAGIRIMFTPKRVKVTSLYMSSAP